MSRARDRASWLIRDFGDDAERELERRLAEPGRAADAQAIYLRARVELRRLRRRDASGGGLSALWRALTGRRRRRR